MRTIVDLAKDRIKALDELARARGQSRAQVFREAVDDYLDQQQRSERRRILDRTFGAWKGKFNEDGVDYQRRVRAEWDRACD